MRIIAVYIVSCFAFSGMVGAAQQVAHPLGIPKASYIKRYGKGLPPPPKGECQLLAERLGEDHVEALQCRAADNDVVAMYLIGRHHEFKVSSPEDISFAVEWYERAAGALDGPLCEEVDEVFTGISGQKLCLPLLDYGTPVAQYHLGLLYAAGTKLDRDLKQSRFWLLAAKVRGLEQVDAALVALDDLERRIAERQAKEAEQ
ncbi:SEL1-like repeat protein [Kordiimonas lipolytica]|uniref:SEL1-like repeat protein n=1 Tax=Kordiimonas lipolytica TaxID=1662421 RepID=A0ABV8U9E6_9PROT|nr:SEL1-like repeat protein [Kordiimonas lipolytica]